MTKNLFNYILILLLQEKKKTNDEYIFKLKVSLNDDIHEHKAVYCEAHTFFVTAIRLLSVF